MSLSKVTSEISKGVISKITARLDSSNLHGISLSIEDKVVDKLIVTGEPRIHQSIHEQLKNNYD